MFTGIITDVGEVLSVTGREAGTRIRISTSYDPKDIALGASIACAGACLTVVEREREGGRGFFEVDVSPETLARTTIGAWRAGQRVNLERPLKLGDELGGHLVAGHVDGVATIVSSDPQGEVTRFVLEAPEGLARYIAEKGSVALDGTSLTVNSVEGRRFEVMLIPHTLAVTTWGALAAGDRVNLEVDLMARYLERLAGRP
jgi:riboflavin synthase